MVLGGLDPKPLRHRPAIGIKDQRAIIDLLKSPSHAAPSTWRAGKTVRLVPRLRETGFSPRVGEGREDLRRHAHGYRKPLNGEQRIERQQ